MPGLPDSIRGTWGLYEIRLVTSFVAAGSSKVCIPTQRKRYFSLFMNEDGRCFLPTAKHIWETLLATTPTVSGCLPSDESQTRHDYLLQQVEKWGQPEFDALRHLHTAAVMREEERGNISFTAKKGLIERLGLPEVIHYRMSRLQEEERQWQEELNQLRDRVPEIRTLLLLQMGGVYP